MTEVKNCTSPGSVRTSYSVLRLVYCGHSVKTCSCESRGSLSSLSVCLFFDLQYSHARDVFLNLLGKLHLKDCNMNDEALNLVLVSIRFNYL